MTGVVVTWETLIGGLLAFITVVGTLAAMWRAIIGAINESRAATDASIKDVRDSHDESIKRIHARLDDIQRDARETFVAKEVYFSDLRLIHQSIEEQTTMITALAQQARCPIQHGVSSARNAV